MIKPVLYELSIVNDPPAIPAEACRALKSPDISCYKNGKIIYYALEDGSVVHLDTVSRTAKGFFREKIMEKSAIFYALVGAPFSDILKYDALYSLHSAALSCNGVGYLFSGDSGSGKTTSTLSLVTHGFKYTSDDAVLLEEAKGDIIAHSLTKTFNVDRKTGERFPGIVKEKNLPVKKEAKIMVNIEHAIPNSFIPSLRPDVIIFLKISSNRKSHIYPINQVEVFRKLIKQTVLAAEKDIAQDQTMTFGTLARQVRGFQLLSGRDIYEEPGILLRLIREMCRENAGN